MSYLPPSKDPPKGGPFGNGGAWYGNPYHGYWQDAKDATSLPDGEKMKEGDDETSRTSSRNELRTTRSAEDTVPTDFARSTSVGSTGSINYPGSVRASRTLTGPDAVIVPPRRRRRRGTDDTGNGTAESNENQNTEDGEIREETGLSDSSDSSDTDVPVATQVVVFASEEPTPDQVEAAERARAEVAAAAAAAALAASSHHGSAFFQDEFDFFPDDEIAAAAEARLSTLVETDEDRYPNEITGGCLYGLSEEYQGIALAHATSFVSLQSSATSDVSEIVESELIHDPGRQVFAAMDLEHEDEDCLIDENGQHLTATVTAVHDMAVPIAIATIEHVEGNDDFEDESALGDFDTQSFATDFDFRPSSAADMDDGDHLLDRSVAASELTMDIHSHQHQQNQNLGSKKKRSKRKKRSKMLGLIASCSLFAKARILRGNRK